MASAARRGSGDLGYRPDLDGIRAVAVLAVMAYHASFAERGWKYRGGFLGVDVFFVLSGYLITTLLVREWDKRSHIKLGYFYARRALRLLPALLAAIVFAGVVTAALHGSFPRPFYQSALMSVSYVANWFQMRTPLTPLGHTWSLSIEEQYYLIWPTMLLLALRSVRSRTTIATIALAGAVAMALIRAVLFDAGHAAVAALSTFSRPDGVLIGSALALILSEPPAWLQSILRRREFAAVCVIVIALATVKLGWEARALYFGGLVVVNLCTAGVVGHLTLVETSMLRRWLSVPPLPFIGRISYGLYLFHVPALYLAFGFPPHRTGIVPLAAMFGISFALAIVSYLTIESFALRYRTRFGSMSHVPTGATDADADR